MQSSRCCTLKRCTTGLFTGHLSSFIWDPDSIERQAHVVFCERCGCCPRTGHVVQLRKLSPSIKFVVTGKLVQQRCHPPRKSLHFPYAAQANLRISLKQFPFST